VFKSPCVAAIRSAYLCRMKNIVMFLVCILLLCASAMAAPKPHVVAFGKWTTIKWVPEDDSIKPEDIRVRPLYVDGHAKEYTVGLPHDVTERAFVVQRMFRLNESLPQESGPSLWRWERGGWLLTNRVTGKIQPINLPEFDPYLSPVSWFRDYAAYCGLSDDGKKSYAMIVQLGRRKPLLKKPVAEADIHECMAPVWQRMPVRATFEPKGEQKFTFSVRSRAVDIANEDSDGDKDDGEQ
jgi:hypothetical protein